MEFPTTVSSIEERIERIDPEAYARTRNYLSGAVSQLSPYLSRGMISPRYVYARLRQRHSAVACSRFLSELLWREYFQRLQQHDPSIEKNPRLGKGSGHRAVPAAIMRAATGITAIDAAIETLYSSGYMHNHARLYTAAVCMMAGYPICSRLGGCTTTCWMAMSQATTVPGNGSQACTPEAAISPTSRISTGIATLRSPGHFLTEAMRN